MGHSFLVSSVQLHSVTVSQMLAVNGFLDGEPVLFESGCPARSEAQGSKTGTADLQNITHFLC